MCPREILSIVSKRDEILHAIADGTVTKRQLKERVSVSRSTIDRAIKNLEEKRILKRSGDSYEFTPYGKLIHTEYRRTTDRVSTFTAAKDLLQYLPANQILPPEVFADATLFIAESPNPDSPRTRFEDRIRRAETVVGLSSTVTSRNMVFFSNQILIDNLKSLIFLKDTAVEHLKKTHPEKLRMIHSVDHAIVQPVEEVPSFSITVIDWTESWIGIYDEHGHLKGFITTGSPAAVQWSQQQLLSYSIGTEMSDQRPTDE